MVIGEGCAGKTTIINAFVGGEFKDNTLSTCGIEQHLCELAAKSLNVVTVQDEHLHWNKKDLRSATENSELEVLN